MINPYRARPPFLLSANFYIKTYIKTDITTRISTLIAVWIVGMALVAGGCASPPPPPLVLSVSNELSRNIAEIWTKPCGESDSGLSEIEGSKLRPGERRGFVLPASCVDLLAFDERGKLVGVQRDLSMLPGARWVLRN